MTNPDSFREAEQFFHQRIPITRAMGVQVVPDPRGFALEAPVALNYNHLQTAFGGSINAVATLAAYGLLWLELRQDPETHVVVRESSIRFLRPIRETIHAVCRRPAEAELEALKLRLNERGKGRIELNVLVEEDDDAAAEFKGTFVALRSVSGK